METLEINLDKTYYVITMIKLMKQAIKEKKSYTMSNQLLNDVFDELCIVIK